MVAAVLRVVGRGGARGDCDRHAAGVWGRVRAKSLREGVDAGGSIGAGGAAAVRRGAAAAAGRAE
eukprot:3086304-Pleurochrysis_carterae.AAC.1